VITSGNHLLTQVKDNQPKLRRRLQLGSTGRKPSGSATSKASGRNRWETRELTVFPAKAWFRGTHWDGLIKSIRCEHPTYRRHKIRFIFSRVFGVTERASWNFQGPMAGI